MSKKETNKESVLKDYVEFKVKVDSLVKELDAKKKAVVDILLSLESREALVDDVKISLRRTVKWEYSKKVALKEETIKAETDILKIMKKEEEESGKATVLEENYTPVVK